MQNKFIFNNKDFNKELEFTKDTNLNIFCILKNNVNFKLKINVSNEASIIVNIVVFANNKANINIDIETNSLSNDSKINVNLNCIVDEFAKINATLNSIVERHINYSIIKQDIKGILLSNDAKILGIPKLTINSDTVNATHSLSIGGINEEELFYLMTKGFSFKKCKEIILKSYLMLVLENLNKFKKLIYFNKVNKLIQKR